MFKNRIYWFILDSIQTRNHLSKLNIKLWLKSLLKSYFYLDVQFVVRDIRRNKLLLLIYNYIQRLEPFMNAMTVIWHFFDKSMLKSHEEKVHPEKRPYICFCSMTFKYEHNFRSHKIHKHQLNSSDIIKSENELRY